MKFTDPTVLIALLILPVIAWFYIQALKKRRDSTIKFSNVNLLRSATKKKHSLRKHLTFYLTLLILILIIMGLANPNIPLKKTKEGVNVVLSLDVSGSMRADDYEPSRIEAAKDSAKKLLEDLKPKDKAGIVIFESGATTSAYLSPFKDEVIDKLEGIKSKRGKTAIGDGLTLSIDMASSIPNKKKIVILLSDGVNNAGVVSPEEAISYAKEDDVQVYTVGMGSEGKVVIGRDIRGNPQYAKLDEKTLKSIASNTGGKYFKSVDSETLDEIYKTISSDIEREKEMTNIKDWFFIASLLLLLAQLYLNYGRYRILK